MLVGFVELLSWEGYCYRIHHEQVKSTNEKGTEMQTPCRSDRMRHRLAVTGK